MSVAPKTICFLVGAPRSGTTWIQRLLQAHPRICGGEESHFFSLFAAPLGMADELVSPDRKRKLGPLSYIGRAEFDDSLREVWDRIFRNLYEQNPQSTVHLEKTPGHAFCLDNIQRLFPEAKVIFLTRDSRAVASSLVHAGRGWGSHWAPDSYKAAALTWCRHVNAIRRWHAKNPDRPFLQVRYEDAMRGTHAELERMLRFLLPDSEDLHLDDTLRSFEASEAARQDPEGFSRKRGPQGWKEDMPLRGKLVIWRYTRKMMRDLGYDITPLG